MEWLDPFYFLTARKDRESLNIDKPLQICYILVYHQSHMSDIAQCEHIYPMTKLTF